MHRSVTTPATLAALCFALLGCASTAATSSGPSPSLEPSSTAVATPEPLADPTATPAPSPTRVEASREPTHVAGVEPGLYAVTVGDRLRVRSKPGVSDDSEKLEPLLKDNIRLLVIDGPVEASGYDWFHVQPSGNFKPGQPWPSGWVAAGKDGEHWIEPFEFECPSVPTNVRGMNDLSPWHTRLDFYYRISCFSGVEITFKARLEQQATACVGEGPDIVPAWFGDCIGYRHGLVSLKSNRRGVGHVWAPDVDLSIAAEPGAPPEEWPTVEVTGQYDHPDARTCRRVPNVENTPEYRMPEWTILDCRNQFVVTSMRLIED
jgi:hypothetical protein